MEELYKLFNNKDKSQEDFLKFVDFMILNANQRFDNKDIQNDFNYHLTQLPAYIRERFKTIEYQLSGNLADASALVRRASENLKKLT